MNKIIPSILSTILLVSCAGTNKNEFKDLSYKNLIIDRSKNYKAPITTAQFKKDITLLRYAILKAYGARGLAKTRQTLY